MADFSHLINITSKDFSTLKKDLLLLEETYFDAPFIDHKVCAKIDYKETIRLLKAARSLNKLNIRLNKLYEDFRTFVDIQDSRSLSGVSTESSQDNDRIAAGASAFNTDYDTASGDDINAIPGVRYDMSDSAGTYITNGGSTLDPNNDAHIYRDFIFGLRREIPLAMSSQLDLQAKTANVNISKDLFKKIVLEILDYEKNYNANTFTSGGLYNALKPDIMNNGKEVLLPYVITNVLTYLNDSNFIGYYGKDGKNSFRIMDRDGLKLWANSIL